MKPPLHARVVDIDLDLERRAGRVDVTRNGIVDRHDDIRSTGGCTGEEHARQNGRYT